MVRVAIYNRCSTEEEAQKNALNQQVEESREFANAMGWVVVRQYVESKSATSGEKRSQYQRMITEMKEYIFDLILIKSIDRLNRCAKDWYIFVDLLNRYEKQLYMYIDRQYYKPEDSLSTGIKAIMAEDFSRELSKKIKNAHARRQKKGTGYNITVPMFGWRKVEKDVYEIDEKQAKWYRLSFELAKQGKTFTEIANYMYEQGVRGRKGNKISAVQWRKMIYSPRASGIVILHQKEYDFVKKKEMKVPQEEWIYIENALPPIVDKEYQQKILSVLQERNRKKV